MNVVYLLFGVGCLGYFIHWSSSSNRPYPYHWVFIPLLSVLGIALILSEIVRPTVAFRMPVRSHVHQHVEVKPGQAPKTITEARYEHQRMLWDWEQSKFIPDGPVEFSSFSSEKESNE